MLRISTIFLFLITLTTLTKAQDLGDMWYTLNFEDTTYLPHVRFDNTSDTNNIWQIGIPQKSILSSAYSSPRVIITDADIPYPTNDTSSFTIVNVVDGGGFPIGHTVVLAGQYYVHSDSLTDFGKIEFSPDNGKRWIDLITDTVYANDIEWLTTKPVLTGSSNGWKYFFAHLARLGPRFKINYRDTVLYRFSFISDSIHTNKDGLMFDDLHFEDWAEGLEEFYNGAILTVSPNPASAYLDVHVTTPSISGKLQVINHIGEVIYTDEIKEDLQIDISKFSTGIYFLRYEHAGNRCMKKFVVVR